jgi:hypothetical protein
VAFEILVTDTFREWYEGLQGPEQESVRRVIHLLEDSGPSLVFPYSSGIHQSMYSHMRELRIQHEGRPYRVLYAFNPERSALLLVGGDKTGADRWYESAIPQADKLYTEHLRWLRHRSE